MNEFKVGEETRVFKSEGCGPTEGYPGKISDLKGEIVFIEYLEHVGTFHCMTRFNRDTSYWFQTHEEYLEEVKRDLLNDELKKNGLCLDLSNQLSQISTERLESVVKFLKSL